jgi:hypothetical protein
LTDVVVTKLTEITPVTYSSCGITHMTSSAESPSLYHPTFLFALLPLLLSFSTAAAAGEERESRREKRSDAIVCDTVPSCEYDFKIDVTIG